jgi:hypothetical protein
MFWLEQPGFRISDPAFYLNLTRTYQGYFVVSFKCLKSVFLQVTNFLNNLEGVHGEGEMETTPDTSFPPSRGQTRPPSP